MKGLVESISYSLATYEIGKIILESSADPEKVRVVCTLYNFLEFQPSLRFIRLL